MAVRFIIRYTCDQKLFWYFSHKNSEQNFQWVYHLSKSDFQSGWKWPNTKSKISTFKFVLDWQTIIESMTLHRPPLMCSFRYKISFNLINIKWVFTLVNSFLLLYFLFIYFYWSFQWVIFFMDVMKCKLSLFMFPSGDFTKKLNMTNCK